MGDALDLTRASLYCEQSDFSGEFNGTDFLYIYIYIYMFQAVRRAVNVLNVSTRI